MQKKSAKDIAFNRERARYRHMISGLEHVIHRKDAEIAALRLENKVQKEKNQELTKTIDELIACMKMSQKLTETNDDLLACMKLSQVDLEKLIKRVETEEQPQGTFARLMRIAQGYF
ncbi:MAG: hypothetical protein LUE86_11385 [Clostridiales bacterium]|nr:hypothetical protein [Clostridiales bacterium]